MYAKVIGLTWKYPQSFKELVLRMGDFHMVFNFMATVSGPQSERPCCRIGCYSRRIILGNNRMLIVRQDAGDSQTGIWNSSAPCLENCPALDPDYISWIKNSMYWLPCLPMQAPPMKQERNQWLGTYKVIAVKKYLIYLKCTCNKYVMQGLVFCLKSGWKGIAYIQTRDNWNWLI